MNRRVLGWSLAILAIAIGPMLGRLAPSFLNPVRASTLSFGVIFAIGALSLNILMGYAGQISLGHGAFVGVGALGVGIITGKMGLAFVLGVPVAMLAGAAFAFVVGLPALRIRGLYLAISTVAFAEFMTRFLFPHPSISGGNTGINVPRPRAGSFEFIENADYLAIVMAAFFAVLWIDRNITRTRLGRAMFGIRENEEVAASFGVHVARTKLTAFVIAGALAGLAGALQGAQLGLAQSNVFDFDDSLLYVTMVVVGGMGSRVGVATAAIAFGVLPRMLTGLERWREFVGAALLVYTIARHPGGLAQAMKEARERKAAPPADDGDDALIVPDLPRIQIAREVPALPADAPVLAATDVSVRFGGLQALSGAGVTVRRGTIAGLIGPNGAGKTTLFNVISGFQSVESGRVEFMGRDVTRSPAHERAALGMGRTFQLIGLARNLTVRENFLLAQHPLASHGALASIARLPAVRRAEADLDERARAAIDALGFTRFMETPVRNLSGGQQRLVELGCALVTGPEMLLLDEPSAGLSPAATQSLTDRLRSLRDELGVTILLIEHHIPLVAEVCDEVTVLALGEPLVSGPTADVIGDPVVVAAYLGEEAAAV